MKHFLIFYIVTAIVLLGSCRDADVSELSTEEYTYARDAIPEFESGEVNLSSDTTGSPMHVPGQRNASTTWFFHQPWAAKHYWGKLFRDAVTFLVLAAVITIITRRKVR